MHFYNLGERFLSTSSAKLVVNNFEEQPRHYGLDKLLSSLYILFSCPSMLIFVCFGH